MDSEDDDCFKLAPVLFASYDHNEEVNDDDDDEDELAPIDPEPNCLTTADSL